MARYHANFVTVTSEAIARLAYDAAQCVLIVHFQSDNYYAYEDVPADVYRALLKANSIGGFFHASIREQYSNVQISAADVGRAGPPPSDEPKGAMGLVPLCAVLWGEVATAG